MYVHMFYCIVIVFGDVNFWWLNPTRPRTGKWSAHIKSVPLQCVKCPLFIISYGAAHIKGARYKTYIQPKTACDIWYWYLYRIQPGSCWLFMWAKKGLEWFSFKSTPLSYINCISSWILIFVVLRHASLQIRPFILML